MTSNLAEISDGEGCFEDLHHHLDQDYDESSEIGYSTGGGRVSEIEEEFSGDDINTKHDLESIREVEGGSVGGGDEAVYVAVGRQSEETSMGALVWALDNLVIPSSTAVFLVHVFPQTKYIPTPLGKMPISQANAEQKESHMAQERAKTRQFLHKFLNVCSATQVKVDTILIERDTEAKAILDLIPILNITKLVLGSTKSNLRRIMRSRRGNNGGVAEQILQNAPEFCEVKIICEGKEMSELPLDSPSSSSLLSPRSSHHHPPKLAHNQPHHSSSCGCFNI